MTAAKPQNKLLALALGATTAAAILLAEHYGLQRANLKRTDAYILGTTALDVGYLVYLAASGRKASEIIPLLTIQAVGGLSVKGAYWRDENDPEGMRDMTQLQEALAEIEKLKLKASK
jgi:hypothetical protein